MQGLVLGLLRPLFFHEVKAINPVVRLQCLRPAGYGPSSDAPGRQCLEKLYEAPLQCGVNFHQQCQPIDALRLLGGFVYRLTRGGETSGGRGKRGLEIEVFDINTGKARPAATLSGGETFIAALALALGLADVVESLSGKIRMDTIFIDEGFGSLDTENGAGTLDQVIQVLAALTEGSRAVGLISHVGLVQDAIPQGFYVRSTPSGSRVEERRGLG